MPLNLERCIELSERGAV